MRLKLTVKNINDLEIRDQAYFVYDTDMQGLSLRVEPTGAKNYYFRYRNESGKRKTIKLGAHGVLKPPTARDIGSNLLVEVAQGGDPASKRKTMKEGTDTLGGYIEKIYRPWAETNQKSGMKTVAMIKSAFKKFHGTQITELNGLLFERWKRDMLESGSKSVTVNRYLAALRGALSKAVVWEILEKNPLDGVKALQMDKSSCDRYLEPDENRRLFEALETRSAEIAQKRCTANQWRRERGLDEYEDLSSLRFVDHLEPMIIVSLYTGIRRGELFGLKWQEVNFAKKTLTVTSSTSKTGEVRHIPMNDRVIKTLSEWKNVTDKNKDLVFRNSNGNKFDNVNSSWGNLLKDANIANFRWHDMRHDFASQLVMKGCDLNTVRELMGHKDIKMTLRYAHLAPEHKLRAVESLLEEDVTHQPSIIKLFS